MPIVAHVEDIQRIKDIHTAAALVELRQFQQAFQAWKGQHEHMNTPTSDNR